MRPAGLHTDNSSVTRKGGAKEANEIMCETKEAGPTGLDKQKVTAVKTSWLVGKRVRDVPDNVGLVG